MNRRIILRSDQCAFIAALCEYAIARCDERIGNGSFAPFDRFTAQRTKEQSQEIIELMAPVDK